MSFNVSCRDCAEVHTATAWSRFPPLPKRSFAHVMILVLQQACTSKERWVIGQLRGPCKAATWFFIALHGAAFPRRQICNLVNSSALCLAHKGGEREGAGEGKKRESAGSGRDGGRE
eukprot:3144891-Pleurochrysis_carterae.AAC.2